MSPEIATTDVVLSTGQDVLSVISGFAVGFSLSLIGGGGSILAVPLLLYLVGYPNPHVVIGTTALAVSANAFLNLVPHAYAGNVRWKEAILFAIVGAMAAFAGSTAGKAVGSGKLLFLFAILMLVIAALMLRRGMSADRRLPTENRAAAVRGKTLKLLAAACAVGLLSGFFGIGGGFLIVPGLVFPTGMSMISAIGSSLLSVGTFGLVTALNYARSGLLDWKVAGLYLAGGTVGGWLGSRLAIRLGHSRKGALNVIFSVVVMLVALYILYRNLSAFTPQPAGLLP
ncbi:MAG: sulfite exporter TauE/SafE family protein [Acidiferrobacterales bacterium]